MLLLLEGPKMRTAILGGLAPERAERYARVSREINQSVTGYVVGDLATSVICGVVVFVTLAVLGVPFPLLWALWVALVDFLPMIGGALAGIRPCCSPPRTRSPPASPWRWCSSATSNWRTTC